MKGNRKDEGEMKDLNSFDSDPSMLRSLREKESNSIFLFRYSRLYKSNITSS